MKNEKNSVRRDSVNKALDNSSDIWERLGPWWDEDIGDGDEFHRELIFPIMKEFIQLEKGNFLLDIGCGNGALIRCLHKENVTFVGADYSKSLIESAKNRSEPYSSVIYQICDATNRDALEKLSTLDQKSVKYDVVVCSMVMHDLSTIEPLYKSLPGLLRKGGLFIFSLPSPHYNSVYNSMVKPTKINNTVGVFTTGYNTVTMKMEKAKINQPFKQYNFHRPLELYINPLVRENRFILTAIREPVATTPELVESSDFWRTASTIPQVTICSFRY